MKQLLLLTFITTSLALFASPFVEWDFEAKGPRKATSYSKNKKFTLYDTKEASGFKGNGLLINQSRPRGYFKVAENWKAFTIELKFKLNKEVDAKVGNALVCYAKNTWNRGQFLLRINPKKQLEARFTQKARTNELVVTSKILDIKPNVFYTVRVSSQDKGALKIFFDGELVAIKETDSWGLNCLNPEKIPSGYPLLTFGNDLANPAKFYRDLNGVMDDIKIWNSFKEADAASVANAGTSLLLKEGQEVSTEKFLVLDRPTRFLGGFERPEQKFFDNAATAKLQLTAKDLIVKVVSPIPKGMKVDTGKHRTWSGDVVEIFIRPNLDSKEYFQYAANASKWHAALCNNPRSGKLDFKSKSATEIEVKDNEWIATFTIPRSELHLEGNVNGKVISANFTRSGKTAGGMSTWSPVGTSWHAFTKYRQIVIGSYQAALEKKLAESKKEFASISGTKELRKQIAGELSSLEATIKKNGNKSELFEGLYNSIERMSLRYIQLRFSGTPNFIWQGQLPWNNDIQVSFLSKPLKKLSLKLPKNSFVYTSFIFSNLTNKPFLGQLKLFPIERVTKKQVYNNFNDKFYEIKNDVYQYTDSTLYPNVKFYEALPIIASDVILDPFVELPMGTLLRANGNESKQIWLKFSSKNMNACKQNYKIILKPSNPGFDKVEIDLEVEVLPIDLATVKVDAFNYTNIYRNGAHPELIKKLVEKENNLIYMGGAFGQRTLDIYPKVDKKGNVIKYSDYALIDKFIDRTIKAGMPLERIKLICWLELQTYGLCYKGKGQLKFNTPEFNKAFALFLKDFTNHLEKKYKITKDRVIFYTVDEPDGDINKKGTRMYNAYHAGKIIKEAGKDYVTMVNPHPNYLRGKDFSAMKKLNEVTDIFEFYRPGLGPEQLKAIKSLKKVVWTYSIHGKTTSPDTYRRTYWANLRDNFTAVSAYWHHENHAGGDGFNSNDGIRNRVDYGNTYLDMDMGTYLTSKREEANMLGKEDYKLATYCRMMLKKKPSQKLQKELDAIIAKGARRDMKGMDEARALLLDLAAKLK